MTEEGIPLINQGESDHNAVVVQPSRKSTILHWIVVLSCIAGIAINFSFAIYKGVKGGESGIIYALMGTSLGGFVVVEILLIIFIRLGVLGSGTWFVYLVAISLIIQSIFVDLQFRSV